MSEELPRRRFLLTLAGAGLASCTSSSGPTCAGSGAGSGANYCLVRKEVLRVVGGASLATNSAALVALDDNTAAVLIRDALGLYALSGICTHACCLMTVCTDASCGAPVSFPSGCSTATVVAMSAPPTIFCPCHGSEFDASGAVVNGPASVDLPAFAVTVDGEDALIDCSRVVPAAARV